MVDSPLDMARDVFDGMLDGLLINLVRQVVMFVGILLVGLLGLVLIIYGTDVLVSLGLGETVAGYLTRAVVIGGGIVAFIAYVWRSDM